MFLTSFSTILLTSVSISSLGERAADVAPLLREALYDEVYVRLASCLSSCGARVCVHDELRRHPFLAAARRSPLDNSTKKANIGRIASLMSMRAGLLELRSWASPGETADPANRTTRGRRLDILDKLGKAVNPYLDPTKQQEMYSVGVGKLLGNNCPKLEARAPPSSIERVGVQDVHMVLCAGDSPLLGINAKGSSLLGAEILKEMRKSDAVARYQGANVASNKALRTNLHSGYEEAMAVYPGASFACGVDDDASSLPNFSRNKEVRGAGWGEGAAAGKPVGAHSHTERTPSVEWRKLSGGSVGKISYNEEESIAYGKNGQVREDFIKRSRLNAATLDAFTSEVRARGGGGGGPPRHPPPPSAPRPPPFLSSLHPPLVQTSAVLAYTHSASTAPSRRIRWSGSGCTWRTSRRSILTSRGAGRCLPLWREFRTCATSATSCGHRQDKEGPCSGAAPHRQSQGPSPALDHPCLRQPVPLSVAAASRQAFLQGQGPPGRRSATQRPPCQSPCRRMTLRLAAICTRRSLGAS